VFEEFDKDDDGQLSADEMQAIEGNRRERIRQADADEDGIVDRDELLRAFSAPPRSE
jgi:Ca2+-binding EF-hand superfamily protein